MRSILNKLSFFCIAISLHFFSCSALMQLVNQEEIPLTELSEKVKNAQGGETIWITPGEYKDLDVRITKRVDKDVTIKVKEPGSVIVSGASTFLIINSNNIKLEGFLFEKVTGATIVMDNSQEITIADNYFYQCGSSPSNSIVRFKNGASNNRVSYNTFDDSRALGVVIATSRNNPRDERNTGNEIFNNYFVNTPSVKSVYPESNGNGMEAIQIGHDLEETIGFELKIKVYRNLFENIIGDGMEIISNKSSANEIYENTFLNNRSGITIRSGNGVTIRNNYLDKTTRGIRVFGADHIIQSNYIRNPTSGISLPSADFPKGGKMTQVGYYQQENVDILDNVIENPTTEAVVIGSGTRQLLPENIRISRNRIYVNDNSRDFNVSDRASRSRIIYDLNETISATQVEQRSTPQNNSEVRRDLGREAKVNEITGVEPFRSNDPKVGAKWKRPSVK